MDGTTEFVDPAATPPVAVPPTPATNGDNIDSPVAESATPGSGLENLPPYTRSILRIQVPVVVTLARKRQPLSRIVELGPGSIIHFAKSCDQMLELEVAGHGIAAGEAVKVGDKFGLRISAMILPKERFQPVRKQAE